MRWRGVRWQQDRLLYRSTGADGRSLSRSIRQRGAVDPVFVADLEEVPGVLSGMLDDGDVLLTQGAGNVAALAQTLRVHDFSKGVGA